MSQKIRKIALIGPESTGKSTLAQQVAQILNCRWVEEYARTYIDQLNRPYMEADLLEIAKKQVALEKEAEKRTQKYLVLDTTLTVLRVWSEHKYGQCHPWILDAEQNCNYDLYLVCDIDLPWQKDTQREHPHLRDYFFNRYLDFAKQNPPYAVISGTDDSRLKNALAAIQQYEWS